jgi:uncharacterized membrane protein
MTGIVSDRQAPVVPPGVARVVAVDAARAIAVIGMITMHLSPPLHADGGPTLATTVIAGRAAALFAVLAGVGVALSTGGSAPPRGRDLRLAAIGLVARAAAVGLVGVTLQLAVHPPVAVILTYYGLLFLVAVPLLRLRAATLVWLAAGWCLVGPVLAELARAHLPGWAWHGSVTDPLGYLATLLVTGYYPVLTWVTYLLAGMAIGRSSLRRPGAGVRLLVVGTALVVFAQLASALVLGPLGGVRALAAAHHAPALLLRTMSGGTPSDSWWWLAVTAPHSGTPFDLAATTGSSLAILGGCLLLARAIPRATRAFAAVGAIPLTLYSVHMVALVVDRHAVAGGPAHLLPELAGVVLIAAAVRWAGGRGPLEAIVARTSRAVRRAASTRLNGEYRRSGGGPVPTKVTPGSAEGER